jgi:hypothetical protein
MVAAASTKGVGANLQRETVAACPLKIKRLTGMGVIYRLAGFGVTFGRFAASNCRMAKCARLL